MPASDFLPHDAPSGHQTVFDGDEAIYFETDPGGTPGDKYGTPADFPKNYMYLYKLSVSVASSDLTVALVDLDGNSASATNPIRVRIGDVEHTLAAALSVTAADATNWCAAGSTELATLAVGYFVYLGYNATDGVVIGFSRIPYARKYSDFSTTSTDETFCKISTITTAGANDVYQNIGYFEAVLSAGAGYTWSGVANVISEPRDETNLLTFTISTAAGNLTAGSGTPTTVTDTAKYRIRNRQIYIEHKIVVTNKGTAAGYLRVKHPFTLGSNMAFFGTEYNTVGYSCIGITPSTTTVNFYKYEMTTIWQTGHEFLFLGWHELP